MEMISPDSFVAFFPWIMLFMFLSKIALIVTANFHDWAEALYPEAISDAVFFGAPIIGLILFDRLSSFDPLTPTWSMNWNGYLLAFLASLPYLIGSFFVGPGIGLAVPDVLILFGPLTMASYVATGPRVSHLALLVSIMCACCLYMPHYAAKKALMAPLHKRKRLTAGWPRSSRAAARLLSVIRRFEMAFYFFVWPLIAVMMIKADGAVYFVLLVGTIQLLTIGLMCMSRPSRSFFADGIGAEIDRYYGGWH